MKIYVTLDLPTSDATSVAYSLERIAEDLHDRGYTDGETERAPGWVDGQTVRYSINRFPPKEVSRG